MSWNWFLKFELKKDSFFINHLTKVSWKHYKWDIEKNEIAYSTAHILKQPTCETFISIRITLWGFNISLIWQNLRSKILFRANFQNKTKNQRAVALSWIGQRTWNFHQTLVLVLAFKKIHSQIFCHFCLSVIKMT